MLRKIMVTLLLVVIVISTAVPVSALESFSRADVIGNTTETRLSREMYTIDQILTATTLGLDSQLTGITDICCDDSGNIYVLCGKDSRLVRISSDYKKGEEISIIDKDGQDIHFKGAKGIFYDNNDKRIFITDTDNGRILVADNDGKVVEILEAPKSDLIPDDFIYQPIAVNKDGQGFTYILSLGCYYGALLYSPKGEFLGFYGANTTQASALDTLTFLWNKLVGSETKRALSVRALPYSFVAFDFDPQGYMVTCTGSTSDTHFESLKNNGKGQIKKISSNGANILYKRSLNGKSESSSDVNFLEERLSFGELQDLISIAVSDDNYIYALDRGYGIIYVYDSECNLMSAFGGGFGNGEEKGLFKDAVSIDLFGDKVFVADAENCSVTIFDPTFYGNALRKAQNSYIKGDYIEAEAQWNEVLSLNRNCQLAYRGMAMAYYNKGDYDSALEAARIAMDYSVYELAWSKKVISYITNNFVLLLLSFLVVVGILAYIIIRVKKQNKVLITNKKLKLVLTVPFHPFESYRALKEKQLGSIWLAVVITILFYISSVLNVISSGFLYNTTLIKNYNSLYTLGSTIGLLLLWSISNWLVCTMFEGKGYFKEVYVASSYSVVPLIAFSFIRVIFSNFLPLSFVGILNGIEIALIIYTVFLLAIALMEIHEYDFFKVLWTSIVTIFFMILVVFILFMCAILLKQLYTFIVTIYEEIAFR